MYNFDVIKKMISELNNDEMLILKSKEYNGCEFCNVDDEDSYCSSDCHSTLTKTYYSDMGRKPTNLYIFFRSVHGGSMTLRKSDHYSKYNQIISIEKMKATFKNKVDKVWESKRPKNQKNHVGVELEFISQLSDTEISNLIAENDLEEYVELKQDGSIDSESDYEYTHEVCICATEDKICNIIAKLCALLKDSSKVNTSCGLHVHLDMRNRNPNKCYTNLFSMQKLLYSMCPGSRQSNSYSIPEYKYYEVDFDDTDDNRYRGINYTSFGKHGTIEVRIHSGSLNPKKINNWIKILIRIINVKTAIGTKKGSLVDHFLDAKNILKLRGHLERYVLKRIKNFEEIHKESKMKIAL